MKRAACERIHAPQRRHRVVDDVSFAVQDRRDARPGRRIPAAARPPSPIVPAASDRTHLRRKLLFEGQPLPLRRPRPRCARCAASPDAPRWIRGMTVEQILAEPGNSTANRLQEGLPRRTAPSAWIRPASRPRGGQRQRMQHCARPGPAPRRLFWTSRSVRLTCRSARSSQLVRERICTRQSA